MRELGLVVKKKAKKRRTTNSQHPWPRHPNFVQELEIVGSNQVWVSDITYVHLRYECIYLAVIMDVFTSAIRGWQLSQSVGQQLTLVAMQRALIQWKSEIIHHSDQGLQHVAKSYSD